MTALPNKKDADNVNLYHYNKSTVLQDARVFNETPVSPRKCRALLSQVVYLLYAGETFTSQEATTVFFGVTRLFQNKDSALRQAVYLAIKELSNTAEDVIMVTSSIMKDMQPNSEVIYRPNAIRALYPIIDPQMVHGVERFFKAAIVDKNPSISSAALVSAYNLFPGAKDIIKRWVNEIQEALNSKHSSGLLGGSIAATSYLGFGASSQTSGYQAAVSTSYIVQYHALGLLYTIRQQERVAIMKMTQGFGTGKSGSSSSLKNAMALCLLVRYAVKVMEEDSNVQKPMYELLEGLLRHKSAMVNYEAARAICELKTVTNEQLVRPISVLQLLMSSPKTTLKFAALRTLSALALTRPGSVAACNTDMEKLISDPNRSVATYAITTLLKTGNESSVDRLMKQISSFMSEISDEFKVIVVNAVRTLCLKYPSKQATMLTFLAAVFRDEGGFDFKRAVIETISEMVKAIPECREQALANLCEFIEDCEFTKLSVQILHLLGVEGPKMPKPSKYIRFIYNRVVLENAVVRGAAVSTMAKFGTEVSDASVQRNIRLLLTQCLEDPDDEVRDRAALSLSQMDDKYLASKWKTDVVPSLAILEQSLLNYLQDPSAHDTPFDLTTVPTVSREEADRETAQASALPTFDVPPPASTPTSAARPATLAETSSTYAQQLAEIPEFQTYGRPLSSSSKPAQLTESDTEYQVACVKHIFKDNFVFQFNVSNTLPDTVLEQVTIIMEPQTASGIKEDFIIPVPSLKQETSPGPIYVSFTRQDPEAYTTETFRCTLQFVSKEIDPTSGQPDAQGYEDEYQLEDVELAAGDYITPSYSAFSSEWDRLSAGATATEVFVLSAMENIKAACKSLVEILNMEPLGGSENPTSSSVHTLQLSGLLVGGGGKILARCRMTSTAGQGVTLELAVRAEKQAGCSLVFAAIGG